MRKNSKSSPQLRALNMMRQLRKQLAAMNCSGTHAASWVEPWSTMTTKRIKLLDAVISDLAEDITVES